MKSLFRFSIIGLLVIGLNAHATQPTAEDRREPVILDLYRAIGSALYNGPVVISAVGAAMVAGLASSSRPAPLLPMAGTFFATLLLGNYFISPEN